MVIDNVVEAQYKKKKRGRYRNDDGDDDGSSIDAGDIVGGVTAIGNLVASENSLKAAKATANAQNQASLNAIKLQQLKNQGAAIVPAAAPATKINYTPYLIGGAIIVFGIIAYSILKPTAAAPVIIQQAAPAPLKK